MTRYALPIAFAVIMSCGPAFAQVGGMNGSGIMSPLGATSPLGLGVGSPITPTGIPMGATELATPGVSPMPTDTPTMGTVGVMPPCPSTDPSVTATSVFDGGGMTPTTMATCPTTASSLSMNPAASASSPTGMGSTAVGRPGIPLGSVELGGGGLSPLPDPTVMIAPMTAPAPMTTPTVMPGSTLMATPAPSATIVCPIMSTPSPGAATALGSC